MSHLSTTTKITALIALSALTLAGCASKPDRGERRGGPSQDRGGAYQGGIIARPLAILLTGMDKDEDYQVSGEEFSDGIAQEWSHLSGGLGEVSVIELGAWSKTVMGSAEAMPNAIAFDRDLNGRITELEFGDRLRAEFVILDKDEDGRVTREELISRLPAPDIQNRQAGGRGQGRSGGGRGEGPPRR